MGDRQIGVPLCELWVWCLHFSVLLVADSASKPGTGKLQPAGQIQLATCFCTALELRMFFAFIFVFSFLNGWEKSKEEDFMAPENNTKFKFECP